MIIEGLNSFQSTVLISQLGSSSVEELSWSRVFATEDVFGINAICVIISTHFANSRCKLAIALDRLVPSNPDGYCYMSANSTSQIYG